MEKKPIKFDARTKQIVDSLFLTIQQSNMQLELLCQVYLNAKDIDILKNKYQLLPDKSGLVKIDKKDN